MRARIARVRAREYEEGEDLSMILFLGITSV
jgi:hypothetical protein